MKPSSFLPAVFVPYRSIMKKNPYTINIGGVDYHIKYDPGDSTSDFFGGNSNWRGPVWIPINYLIIQSIRQYGNFYGDGLMVEYPAGSGKRQTLEQVADHLTERVVSLFKRDATGRRHLHGKHNWFYQKPGNQDLLLFHEYFHGDNSNGLGASHQTGWTSLVAELISELSNQKETIRKGMGNQNGNAVLKMEKRPDFGLFI